MKLPAYKARLPKGKGRLRKGTGDLYSSCSSNGNTRGDDGYRCLIELNRTEHQNRMFDTFFFSRRGALYMLALLSTACVITRIGVYLYGQGGE